MHKSRTRAQFEQQAQEQNEVPELSNDTVSRHHNHNTNRIDRRTFLLRAGLFAAGSACGCSLVGCSDFEILALHPSAQPRVPHPSCAGVGKLEPKSATIIAPAALDVPQ
jgi:hypothetical protein